MALASAVQGATYVAQSITWTDEDGTAVDLTGATLTGYKKSNSTGTVTALTGTLSATDAANGVFSWTYSSADVATPGKYTVHFRAAYSGVYDKTISTSWTVHDAYDDEV